MIQVERLGKSFRDTQRGWVEAVRDVSFECRPGEIFGLLGPNGAGKTTTLRILSTVLRPTAGRAMVAGYDVVEAPQEVRRRIGFMSANTGIYDRMTAWELVEYFGRLYGLPKDRLRERMETVFGWLKMDDFRDVLGSKMSTGMKQKVSIARTIVHDPPVLIFDEPTSGLDILVQRVVLDKILELRDMGKTIVFSTHSMSEVERLCSRVAIIYRGELQAQGPINELLATYSQPDVEELFFKLVEQADARYAAAGGQAIGAGSNS
ncbi:ABC transporter ATP-binding protein [Paludisphaera rhizosphaerae]|uniref:ABC transporter ATP-binding protein n=1 Tax=Paludisphaera rhizosphaerae TaxID=2711216 RepID=UPI0013EBE8A7|nr:ATP-binding cassette domain-containing protein [Paludisphaera rhizosphaerae]